MNRINSLFEEELESMNEFDLITSEYMDTIIDMTSEAYDEIEANKVHLFESTKDDINKMSDETLEELENDLIDDEILDFVQSEDELYG